MSKLLEFFGFSAEGEALWKRRLRHEFLARKAKKKRKELLELVSRCDETESYHEEQIRELSDSLLVLVARMSRMSRRQSFRDLQKQRASPDKVIQDARKFGSLERLARTCIDQTVLIRLAESQIEDSVRLAMAENPSIKEDAWDALVRNSDGASQIMLMVHTDMPDDVEWHLSRSVIPAVRETLASVTGHPDILEAMADDPESSVRSSVAANTATPANALETLLDDENQQIRVAAFLHPKTPVRAQMRAYEGLDEDSREEIEQMEEELPDSLKKKIRADRERRTSANNNRMGEQTNQT